MRQPAAGAALARPFPQRIEMGQGDYPMRSPNGPMFKRYEIAVIICFLAAAAMVTGFRLVY